MKHIGDITKIDGSTIPPVDCIIGGSPCQDLSVAGKRAGLSGERSGLFSEQIRIIREMREESERTNELIRPRFAVWENVPGALSSNKGEDFREVLEAFCRIGDKNAVVPRPPGGKWRNAGCIVGDGWSVAWRILDAQFWGVPQRRRRIALVADFGGQSAPEILFERKSLRRDTAPGREAREGTSAGTKDSPGSTDLYVFKAGNGAKAGISLSQSVAPTLTSAGSGTNQAPTICIQGNCIDRADTAGCNGKGWRYDKCYTLNTIDRPAVAYGFDSLSSNSMKSKNPHSGCREVSVAKTLDTTYPDPSKNQGGVAILQHAIYDARGNGDGKISNTLTGDHQNRVTDYTAITFRMRGFGDYCTDEIASACKTRDYKDHTDLVIGIDSDKNAYPEQIGALRAHSSGGAEQFALHQNMVRRLTPLECERLQGFPDGWTDIGDWTDSKGRVRKTSDSARYKALCNSIALPPWRFVLRRICEHLANRATMGSLFDGIGGFPLIWEEINGKGSAIWASEIEEFPTAVTKRRFCEQEDKQ